jgi:hypothetical protein
LKTKDNSILTGLRIQISTDPHNFVNLVPDPHSEKAEFESALVKIQELQSIKMELGKAVDAHIGGVEP